MLSPICPKLVYTNKPLRQTPVAKYPSTYIDLYLKLDKHIGKLIPKISTKRCILQYLRKLVPTDTIKL